MVTGTGCSQRLTAVVGGNVEVLKLDFKICNVMLTYQLLQGFVFN